MCLVFSFIFNQAACLLLHPTKPYRGVNFPYQRFLSAAYLDATELFQKRFSPGATMRGTLARYLQLYDWNPVRNRFATTHQIKIYIDYSERVLRPDLLTI